MDEPTFLIDLRSERAKALLMEVEGWFDHLDELDPEWRHKVDAMFADPDESPLSEPLAGIVDMLLRVCYRHAEQCMADEYHRRIGADLARFDQLKQRTEAQHDRDL